MLVLVDTKAVEEVEYRVGVEVVLEEIVVTVVVGVPPMISNVGE